MKNHKNIFKAIFIIAVILISCNNSGNKKEDFLIGKWKFQKLSGAGDYKLNDVPCAWQFFKDNTFKRTVQKVPSDVDDGKYQLANDKKSIEFTYKSGETQKGEILKLSKDTLKYVVTNMNMINKDTFLFLKEK